MGNEMPHNSINDTLVINKTVEYVKRSLENYESGHDWWHINRVWNLSKRIARDERVDLYVVELGALLHDIADSKFHDGDETVGPVKSRQFLQSLYVRPTAVDHVSKIIEHISFKGGNHTQAFRSLELDVVQDADRLDAIGAIGIARTFNYGGFKNRAIYDPNIPPNSNMSKEEYKGSNAPTLNHFYEKLLLLKDKMNTKTGRMLSQQRHEFMERYLEEFYKEWEGEA